MQQHDEMQCYELLPLLSHRLSHEVISISEIIFSKLSTEELQRERISSLDLHDNTIPVALKNIWKHDEPQ